MAKKKVGRKRGPTLEYKALRIPPALSKRLNRIAKLRDIPVNSFMWQALERAASRAEKCE